MSEGLFFVLTRDFWGLEANHAIPTMEIYISMPDPNESYCSIFDRLRTEKERQLTPKLSLIYPETHS